MLRLLLLRHSKAVPFEGSGDRERGLTERGRADAARLGALIAAENIGVRAAVHSGARRTKETLSIVLEALPPGVAVSVQSRIYEATSAALLAVLRQRSDGASPLLLVGHNPSIGQFACELAGQGEARAMADMADKFPTSALAVIDFDVDRWAGVAWGTGRLLRYATPGSLREEGA